jgi:hypothetical protein
VSQGHPGPAEVAHGEEGPVDSDASKFTLAARPSLRGVIPDHWQPRATSFQRGYSPGARRTASRMYTPISANTSGAEAGT